MIDDHVSLIFGPVPPWSAPLRDKLLFGLTLVAALVVFDRIRPKEQRGAKRDVIVTAILMAILCGALVIFQLMRP
jgi:hypothetical protein